MNSNSNADSNPYDVIVIGAGPAGEVLAEAYGL